MVSYDMPRSAVAKQQKGSAIMAQEALATDLEAIKFTAGQPDFATPDHIKKAVIDALQGKAKLINGQPLTSIDKYTKARGADYLREAIALDYQRRFGMSVDPQKQILVSNGGKESLQKFFEAVLNPGDEVVLFAPFWVSYKDMIEDLGAMTIIIDIRQLEQDNADQLLADNISDKVKAIVINSPSNPTGFVMQLKHYKLINDAIVGKPIYVLQDEIYSLLTYEGVEHLNPFDLIDFPRERVVLISGVSKGYAMTGWRIGWAVGPTQLITDMANKKSTDSGCPSAIGQYASYMALTGPQNCVKIMSQAYEKRWNDFIVPFLEQNKLEHFIAQGAFYFFCRLPDKFEGNCIAACDTMIREYGVGLTAGAPFGYPGWIRGSFATSEENIKKGLIQIERFLKS